MAQRVAIARALSGDPKLLIADEPTTALDVTVQAEILELLRELAREQGMAILLVTHDWGVVADICDRVVVMYAGQVVERAKISPIFRSPLHPYTQALLSSNPHHAPGTEMLPTIPGSVPRPGAWPAGCHFHPRCAYATAECGERRSRSFDQATSGRRDASTTTNWLQGERADPPASQVRARRCSMCVTSRSCSTLGRRARRFAPSTASHFRLPRVRPWGWSANRVRARRRLDARSSALPRSRTARSRSPAKDITSARYAERKRLSADLQVVFQDPYSSLNPTRTIRQTLSETLRAQGERDKDKIAERIKQMLEYVGLPAEAAGRYPPASPAASGSGSRSRAR